MIRSGQTIENPVTGERVTFRRTSADTGGQAVEIDVVVEPNGAVAATQLHPSQEERFVVNAGMLEMRVRNETFAARPGDVVLIPAGTPHRFRNVGDEPAQFSCVVRPALGFEPLLETMFALASDGKTNRNGMPNLLRLAVIARAHFDTVRLPFPPAWMQRMGLAVGAAFGRAAGYRATYEGGASTSPALEL
jgi:mannose-6-phosphate isomerase-like protein (cupin superfamily)